MSVLWDRSDQARSPVDDQLTDATPAVERVLRADANLQVYVACGYYDLVCPYAVIDHMVETGANDVMVVKPCEDSRDSRERLIPWLPGSVVTSVDVAGNRVEVDWDLEF